MGNLGYNNPISKNSYKFVYNWLASHLVGPSKHTPAKWTNTVDGQKKPNNHCLDV